MSKIKFENGTTVEFDGDPTPQDIEEVAKSLNLQSPNNTPSQPQTRFDTSQSFGYGDALKNTAKTVLNNYADIGDATINTLKNPGGAIGNLIGGVSKGIGDAATLATHLPWSDASQGVVKPVINDLISKIQNAPNKPIDALLTGATLGAGFEAPVAGRLTAQGLINNTIKGVDRIVPNISKGISNIRDYPANKVTAIRDAFWNEIAPKEYKAFGDAIESLGKDSSSTIDGAKFIQNVEKKLADRGLLSPEGDILKSFNPADSKLIKAYQNISRKWADTSKGNIPIKDVVEEYKSIKGEYTDKPTSTQRANIQSANDFFQSAGDQINSGDWRAANARYSAFKDNQKMIDKAVGLYTPALETAKGERFLTRGAMSETTQGRKVSKMITDITGENLTGAKVITKVNQLNPLNLLRRIK